MSPTGPIDVAHLSDLEPELSERVSSTVWCTLATTDRAGRPRTRVVHPVWDGAVGWLGSRPDTLKLAHLTATPWVSLMYWDPRHQQVAIEARATICDDAASLAAAWAAFSAPPEPYGYDPSPIWPDGPDVGFVAVRLDPVRVSMFGAPPRTWTSPELTRP